MCACCVRVLVCLSRQCGARMNVCGKSMSVTLPGLYSWRQVGQWGCTCDTGTKEVPKDEPHPQKKQFDVVQSSNIFQTSFLSTKDLIQQYTGKSNNHARTPPSRPSSGLKSRGSLLSIKMSVQSAGLLQRASNKSSQQLSMTNICQRNGDRVYVCIFSVTWISFY